MVYDKTNKALGVYSQVKSLQGTFHCTYGYPVNGCTILQIPELLSLCFLKIRLQLIRAL